MKKKIKIKFVDFNIGMGVSPQQNDFVEILSQFYEVVYSDNPDYVFYSVFGNDHLKYECIRIFYTGECYTPNFNECDYAIGFDRLIFDDRYIRVPLYKLFKYKKSYNEVINKRVYSIDDLKSKTKFCNFVYSNCFTKSIRAMFFKKLSEYKRVESGGRYMNNIGGAVKDKRAFQEQTKFTIAFENSSYDGYCTEKLIEAFSAGTVPIYHGDPGVGKDFNTEAFINVHDYNNLDEVVAKVKEVDQNDELYLKMLNANPVLQPVGNEELTKFLIHIFEQNLSDAYRRPRSQTSIGVEQMKLRHNFFEKHIYAYYSKVIHTWIRLKTRTILTSKRTI